MKETSKANEIRRSQSRQRALETGGGEIVGR